MGPSYDADVLVVGAGPVGCVLAMSLAQLGKRTMILERDQLPRDKPCGEGLLPSGAAVLRELGIDLGEEGFPPVRGIRYRLPGQSSALGGFGADGCGYGVRRLRLDALLADRAQAMPGVELETDLEARAVTAGADAVTVETALGDLRAGALVGADGLRSRVAMSMGWQRPARGRRRFGLVGHLNVPGLVPAEVVVTILGDRELYVAPTGQQEVLAALLWSGELRPPGMSVRETYLEAVERAHPEFGDELVGPLRGAGPFGVRPGRVAQGRVFLAGDAAGFIDPLTGDGLASGLAAARVLARLLAGDLGPAARQYRAWERRQWRRRRLLTAIALSLAGSRRRARRALAGIGRRPAALESLIQLSGGTKRLRQVGLLDWAALAGL